MSQLLEGNFPIEEILEKYQQKKFNVNSVEELLKIESEGRLHIFNSQEECFFGINGGYSSLSDVVSSWFELSTKEFEPHETLLDYALRGNNVIELDNGQVIFIEA